MILTWIWLGELVISSFFCSSLWRVCEWFSLIQVGYGQNTSSATSTGWWMSHCVSQGDWRPEQTAWCAPLSCAMIYTSYPSSLLPPQTQAIWFTEQAGSEGSVFGNIDTWKGVALILDSFDNDGLVRKCSELRLCVANSQNVSAWELSWAWGGGEVGQALGITWKNYISFLGIWKVSQGFTKIKQNKHS